MTYLRYNVELSTKWLKKNLGGNYTEDYVRRMAKMDRPGNISDLETLGRQAAEVQIPVGPAFANHFPTAFDPWS